MASRSASFDLRTRARSDDSWVEVSSQPSSSSLSSINDEIITTGLRVPHDPRSKRRRTLRLGAPTRLTISNRPSSGEGASSQEEYEESESESERAMTSSGEGPQLPPHYLRHRVSLMPASTPDGDGSAERVDDEDDEANRIATSFLTSDANCFTPQPNAFSHMPQNILSPSYNPTAASAERHDEALRASLSTLLSCAAAARGLKGGNSSAESKRTAPAATARQQTRGNRIEPISFRLVPESALPPTNSPPEQQPQEPRFKPTMTRRISTSTSASSDRTREVAKRKQRSSSKEQTAVKKARRSSSSEDLTISPTLLTWVLSAGVVVCLTALSFSAGYSLGKEAGRIEASEFSAGEEISSCARQAARSSLGLRRSLARSAVQV